MLQIMGEPLTVFLCCGGVSSARTRFRVRFGIKGDSCEDCYLSYFLCCCSICQMMNEIHIINPPPKPEKVEKTGKSEEKSDDDDDDEDDDEDSDSDDSDSD